MTGQARIETLQLSSTHLFGHEVVYHSSNEGNDTNIDQASGICAVHHCFDYVTDQQELEPEQDPSSKSDACNIVPVQQ